MGYIKKHDARSIGDFPNAYWRVVQKNLDLSRKCGQVAFYGYKDQATSDLSKTDASITPLPGAVKVYLVSPTEYAAYFAPTVLTTKAVDDVAQCYALASNTVDTLSSDELSFQSFFMGAINSDTGEVAVTADPIIIS